MKSVPPAEVYTMKWALHDWNDEDSITILKNTRKAICHWRQWCGQADCVGTDP